MEAGTWPSQKSQLILMLSLVFDWTSSSPELTPK